jgi:hypothetical protein
MRRKIQTLIYRLGLRPKRGSIFFSPSLSFHYALKNINKKKE